MTRKMTKPPTSIPMAVASHPCGVVAEGGDAVKERDPTQEDHA